MLGEKKIASTQYYEVRDLLYSRNLKFTFEFIANLFAQLSRSKQYPKIKESEKRGRFTYEMGEIALQNKAKTSLEKFELILLQNLQTLK